MPTNRIVRTGLRRASAALLVCLSALALTGCEAVATAFPATRVKPWAVAQHEEKINYHHDAAEALLNLSASKGLAALGEFQAVGFHHVETDGTELHMEYTTSVSGESYVSQLATSEPGYSFDQSHTAGSPDTYYLLGDKIKKKVSQGRSWVSVPMGDLNLKADESHICRLFALSYACALIKAWNATRDELGVVPVKLATAENGEQHFTTAVSYAGLEEAGLVLRPGEVDGFLSDEARNSLVPLHIWVDADGVVTKMETNGVLTGENGQELALQIGFELTSRQASQTMKPVDAADIPANDLYRITNEDQLQDFLKKLARL